MKAKHTTSHSEYRAPSGALFTQEEVTLSFDVWEEPEAAVQLRLWIDGEGERLVPMECVQQADGAEPARFAVTIAPETAGTIWYRFNVARANGEVWLYGACEGAVTGEGSFAYGEPPSFRLEVFEGVREAAPAGTDGVAYRCAAECDHTENPAEMLEDLRPLGITEVLPAEESQEDDAEGAGEPTTVGDALGEALVNFVTCKRTAKETAAAMQLLCETSLPGAVETALVAVGGEGRDRLLTRLGNAPANLAPDQQRTWVLSDNDRGLAVGRLWVTALLQMSMPGTPVVYEGDETGTQGFASAPLAEDVQPAPDGNCTTIYRNAIGVRKTLPALWKGSFEATALDDDVLALWRFTDDMAVCVLANQSLSQAQTVRLPLKFEAVDDVVSGREVTVVETEEGKQAEAFLWPLGTSVLYFHADQRLQKPLEEGNGIICHITSVPNEEGPGTLGEPSKRFVDWLAQNGYRYWQVLPVNPTDWNKSPYAGPSAFAGNVELLEGGQEAAAARAEKPLSKKEQASYVRFLEENEEWLLPYAIFTTIKELNNEDPWWDWPELYRSWDPAVADYPELADGIEKHSRMQYEFACKWQELRAYATERGIRIIGDMPMYVSADSADVWRHHGLFNITEDGKPSVLAGCPPDNFAPQGQIWGNPTYRWDMMAKTNYDWWLQRIARAFACYDYVRLDHFLGFSSYYAIPKDKSATEGAWYFGPGIDLFEKAYETFGPLPMIAEDLGLITPAVRALRALTGFAGMDVIQFFDNDPRSDWKPVPGTIAYTSTHDTPTLIGWVEKRYGIQCGDSAQEAKAEAAEAELTTEDSEETPENERVETCADSVPAEALSIARELREKLTTSDAPVVLMQLQDVLELDDSARMNVPGVAEGNWSWQAKSLL